MKTETPHTDEEVWAYLHGELDDAARREFEATLAGDSSLARRTARARRVDRMLRAALPALDAGARADERLAEAALAAWERDQVALAPPQARTVRQHLPGFRRSWLSRPAAAGLIGLAAAALLVVAFYPVLPTARPPQWARPEFSPLVFRGAAAVPRSAACGAEAAQQAQAALAAALTRAVARRGGALPSGLSLSLHLSELRDGAFSVSVRARLADGCALGEWSGDYSSLERFLAHVDASAARLAETLAASAEESHAQHVCPQE